MALMLLYYFMPCMSMSGARGDKVVNLAVNKEALKVIQDFAANQEFDAMAPKRAAADNGPSTIFIKLKIATSEVDGMERYSDEALKGMKSKPGPGAPEQGEN
jgi:hypothetical protein